VRRISTVHAIHMHQRRNITHTPAPRHLRCWQISNARQTHEIGDVAQRRARAQQPQCVTHNACCRRVRDCWCACGCSSGGGKWCVVAISQQESETARQLQRCVSARTHTHTRERTCRVLDGTLMRATARATCTRSHVTSHSTHHTTSARTSRRRAAHRNTSTQSVSRTSVCIDAITARQHLSPSPYLVTHNTPAIVVLPCSSAAANNVSPQRHASP
jgi:hypothetical protein